MGRRLKGGHYGGGHDGGPLKKVVARVCVGGVMMEAYECGHIAMPKSDIIGQTNAARRRCRRCKSGKPVHFVGEPPASMSATEYDIRSSGKDPMALTEADWDRVFKLRCKSKSSGDLTTEEREFCNIAFRADEERYTEMSAAVFQATKPFGAV